MKKTIATFTIYPIEDDPSITQIYNMGKDDYVVGCSSACDIKLSLPKISEVHAKLMITESSYIIVDLASAYGTYLVNAEGHHERLKPNKEYPLQQQRPIYLAGKYRCDFKVLPNQMGENNIPSTLQLEDRDDDIIEKEILQRGNSIPYDEYQTQILPNNDQSQKGGLNAPKGNEEGNFQSTLVLQDQDDIIDETPTFQAPHEKHSHDFMQPTQVLPDTHHQASSKTKFKMSANLMSTTTPTPGNDQVKQETPGGPENITNKKSFQKKQFKAGQYDSSNIATSKIEADISEKSSSNNNTIFTPSLSGGEIKQTSFSSSEQAQHNRKSQDSDSAKLVPTRGPDETTPTKDVQRINNTEISDDENKDSKLKKKFGSPNVLESKKNALKATIIGSEYAPTMQLDDLSPKSDSKITRPRKRGPSNPEDAKTQLIATMTDHRDDDSNNQLLFEEDKSPERIQQPKKSFFSKPDVPSKYNTNKESSRLFEEDDDDDELAHASPANIKSESSPSSHLKPKKIDASFPLYESSMPAEDVDNLFGFISKPNKETTDQLEEPQNPYKKHFKKASSPSQVPDVKKENVTPAPIKEETPTPHPSINVKKEPIQEQQQQQPQMEAEEERKNDQSRQEQQPQKKPNLLSTGPKSDSLKPVTSPVINHFVSQDLAGNSKPPAALQNKKDDQKKTEKSKKPKLFEEEEEEDEEDQKQRAETFNKLSNFKYTAGSKQKKKMFEEEDDEEEEEIAKNSKKTQKQKKDKIVEEDGEDEEEEDSTKIDAALAKKRAQQQKTSGRRKSGSNQIIDEDKLSDDEEDSKPSRKIKVKTSKKGSKKTTEPPSRSPTPLRGILKNKKASDSDASSVDKSVSDIGTSTRASSKRGRPPKAQSKAPSKKSSGSSKAAKKSEETTKSSKKTPPSKSPGRPPKSKKESPPASTPKRETRSASKTTGTRSTRSSKKEEKMIDEKDEPPKAATNTRSTRSAPKNTKSPASKKSTTPKASKNSTPSKESPASKTTGKRTTTRSTNLLDTTPARSTRSHGKAEPVLDLLELPTTRRSTRKSPSPSEASSARSPTTNKKSSTAKGKKKAESPAKGKKKTGPKFKEALGKRKGKKMVEEDEDSEEEDEIEEEIKQIEVRSTRGKKVKGASSTNTTANSTRSAASAPKTRGRPPKKEKATAAASKAKSEPKVTKTAAKQQKKQKQKNSANAEQEEEEEVKEMVAEKPAAKKGSPTVQVLFSGFDKHDKQIQKDKKSLANIGAKVVDDAERDFTVLVMEKFKRTIKFLLAANKGVDIVTYKWVKDSLKSGSLKNPDPYIFADKDGETKHKFKLATTLQKAKKKKAGILSGYKVFVPINIKPSLDELKMLIEACDGQYLKTKPLRFSEDTLVVLNEDDQKNAESVKKFGFTPYTTELIFSGILHQELELKKHKIQ